MKKRDYILAYILALTISFAVCYSHYEQKIYLQHIQIGLREIKTATGQIEGCVLKIDTIEINKALLDKIDELTRENTVLRQEVACQASQLQEYENIVKGD